ncbi:hypothetical protein IE4872_PD02205 (plasmid) [Rhizobium gallicum]|uniref:Uncharacterized protein n=1 Tax=Rhizobium gallicum TaxID=56730 RepID=A0A1L5NXZ6_9HYPH|nr:hypothetical protein IE4872_PD02205 [Rhizobium gallicum]
MQLLTSETTPVLRSASSQNFSGAARGLAFLYPRQTFAVHATIQAISATLPMAVRKLAANDLQMKTTV